jgi:hypothetical protein
MDDLIAAVSLWQPWASLIALGEKEFETRDWIPKELRRGQRLLIHAAQKVDTAAFDNAYIANALKKHGIVNEQLPTGVIVCETELLGVFETELLDRLTPQERSMGNFRPKRYGWQLEVKRVFDPPLRYRGSQGIFWVDAELIDAPAQIQIASPHICQRFTDVVRIEQVLDRYDPYHMTFTDPLAYCGGVHPKYQLPNTIWDNPFLNRRDLIVEEQLLEYCVMADAQLSKKFGQLSGKTIVCACPCPQVCHCHWLAWRANYPVCEACRATQKIRVSKTERCSLCGHTFYTLPKDPSLVCPCCVHITDKQEIDAAVERATRWTLQGLARRHGGLWMCEIDKIKDRYVIKHNEVIGEYVSGDSYREIREWLRGIKRS